MNLIVYVKKKQTYTTNCHARAMTITNFTVWPHFDADRPAVISFSGSQPFTLSVPLKCFFKFLVPLLDSQKPQKTTRGFSKIACFHQSITILVPLVTFLVPLAGLLPAVEKC